MRKLPNTYQEAQKNLPIYVYTKDKITGYYLSANDKKIKKRQVDKDAFFLIEKLSDTSFQNTSQELKGKSLVGSNLPATEVVIRGKKTTLFTFFVYDDLKDKVFASTDSRALLNKAPVTKADSFYGINKDYIYAGAGILLMILGYRILNKQAK